MTLPMPEGRGFCRTLALAETAGSGATLGDMDVSRPEHLAAFVWFSLRRFKSYVAAFPPQPANLKLLKPHLANALRLSSCYGLAPDRMARILAQRCLLRKLRLIPLPKGGGFTALFGKKLRPALKHRAMPSEAR